MASLTHAQTLQALQGEIVALQKQVEKERVASTAAIQELGRVSRELGLLQHKQIETASGCKLAQLEAEAQVKYLQYKLATIRDAWKEATACARDGCGVLTQGFACLLSQAQKMEDALK